MIAFFYGNDDQQTENGGQQQILQKSEPVNCKTHWKKAKCKACTHIYI